MSHGFGDGLTVIFETFFCMRILDRLDWRSYSLAGRSDLRSVTGLGREPNIETRAGRASDRITNATVSCGYSVSRYWRFAQRYGSLVRAVNERLLDGFQTRRGAQTSNSSSTPDRPASPKLPPFFGLLVIIIIIDR